jgi:hypothetical protein
VVWGFTVWFQNMITYSYLPDLTNDDEVIMNEHTISFAALSYVSIVLYMGAIEVLSTIEFGLSPWETKAVGLL